MALRATSIPLVSAACLAAACGGHGAPPAPAPITVLETRAVHDTLRDMDGWRTETGRAAELADVSADLRYEHRTERVFVTEPGRRVAFHHVGVAGDAELGFDLDLVPWGNAAGTEAVVSLIAWPEGGGTPRRVRHTVVLERRAGRGPVPCAFRLDVPGRVQNVAVKVALAGDVEGSPDLALVRPWVREPRAVTPPAHAPRQIVLVTLDTVRRDHLGCYGHARARTPHLDAFAADAALFEDAFSVTNVTNPAHTSLFTSLHLKDHKVRDNFTSLAPDCPTVMGRLADEGFRTAAFVASFNFQEGRSDLGGRFDDFFACANFHERRAEDVNADFLPWLNEHQDEDFFAWVHYFDAHLPYVPPAPWDTAFEPEGSTPLELPLRDAEDVDAQYGPSRNLEEFRAGYLGELAYLDDQFGALVAHLKTLGVYDRAIVVVTSDHGEALGEHGIYCEHRGLYDAVTAIPLLVKPAGEPVGRRVAGLATLLDVYPTLFDYLGLDLGHAVRGASLRPRIEGRSTESPERVFAEHVEGLAVSVRTDDELGVLGLGDREYFPRFATRAGVVELYEDGAPQEAEHDLADERPEDAERLRSELEAFLEDALPLEAVPVEDERYREMLERLGYVEPGG